jgi:hypothetical protein
MAREVESGQGLCRVVVLIKFLSCREPALLQKKFIVTTPLFVSINAVNVTLTMLGSVDVAQWTTHPPQTEDPGSNPAGVRLSSLPNPIKA